MAFHVSVLAQSRHLYVWVLARVLSFHVSSCLVSYDCVLTVSPSGLAKCLFGVETQAFLAESRPVGSFAGCSLALKRLFLWLLFSGYNVS